MPPVLGWAAMRRRRADAGLAAVLIIFVWTPPHFWALALYRAEDYAQVRPADAAGHARHRVHAAARLLYTIVLVADHPAALRRAA